MKAVLKNMKDVLKNMKAVGTGSRVKNNLKNAEGSAFFRYRRVLGQQRKRCLHALKQIDEEIAEAEALSVRDADPEAMRELARHGIHPSDDVIVDSSEENIQEGVQEEEVEGEAVEQDEESHVTPMDEYDAETSENEDEEWMESVAKFRRWNMENGEEEMVPSPEYEPTSPGEEGDVEEEQAEEEDRDADRRPPPPDRPPPVFWYRDAGRPVSSARVELADQPGQHYNPDNRDKGRKGGKPLKEGRAEEGGEKEQLEEERAERMPTVFPCGSTQRYAMEWLAMERGECQKPYRISKPYTPCKYFFIAWKGCLMGEECQFSHNDLFWQEPYLSVLKSIRWKSKKEKQNEKDKRRKIMKMHNEKMCREEEAPRRRSPRQRHPEEPPTKKMRRRGSSSRAEDAPIVMPKSMPRAVKKQAMKK